jgi:hypothetical protein
VQIQPSPLTNSAVVVGLELTEAGTLNVTNTGGILAVGNSFQLFKAGSFTGAFAATNLPSLSAGLAWKFNAANGLLSVVHVVATNSPVLTNSLSGGSLTLSWPTDHTGYRLETQTNSLGTNWFTVAGSTATNAMILPVTKTNSSVFFRLVYP